MAFTEGSNDGALNGTTEVALVAAPSSGVRRTVRNITVYNRDTAIVVLTIKFKNSGTYRFMFSVSLNPNDSIILGEEDCYVLDSTGKSIVAVLGGAIATTNPDFVSSYADAS